MNSITYSDLVCVGDLLFIYKTIWPEEVTQQLVKVELLAHDTTPDNAKAIYRGLIGTCILGLAGTIIGLASASSMSLDIYKLTFVGLKQPNVLIIETYDKHLIAYLQSRME